ncbi:MAG: AtpZ/AtpI family protein [Polyangiales bacterium]
MTERARDLAEVEKKAARLAEARRRRPTLWQHLGHVGALGWVFVLPLVGGVALGRLVAHGRSDHAPVWVGLLVGLAAGGYGAWRQLRRGLNDEEAP